MTNDSKPIILIEDDQQMVRLFEDMFQHVGITIIYLSSSELHQLAGLIDMYQPDTVIMDYVSIINDYDTAINTIPLHITSILLTSIDDSRFQHNIDHCIRKPFAVEQVYSIIDAGYD